MVVSRKINKGGGFSITPSNDNVVYIFMVHDCVGCVHERCYENYTNLDNSIFFLLPVGGCH